LFLFFYFTFRSLLGGEYKDLVNTLSGQGHLFGFSKIILGAFAKSCKERRSDLLFLMGYQKSSHTPCNDTIHNALFSETANFAGGFLIFNFLLRW
jgi:hypothetical protein